MLHYENKINDHGRIPDTEKCTVFIYVVTCSVTSIQSHVAYCFYIIPYISISTVLPRLPKQNIMKDDTENRPSFFITVNATFV